MNNILEVFYNKIIPGMLQGEIDCEILVHMIANVYFEEDGTILNASNQYDGVIIPTLVIKNKQSFNKTITEYVETMLDFYQNFQFAKIDSIFYPEYLLATAFANMGQQDYLDPENYFQKRIRALKETPFNLTESPVPIGYSDDFASDMYYILNKEKPNEECPFKYTLILSNGVEQFEFQTIRFFVEGTTAYIGAIQGNKPEDKSSYQKKIKRILYKANEGLPSNDDLYQTNPGSVIALTSFIGLLNSYGINQITLLPYGIQRWNDKKILYHNLSDKITMPDLPDNYRIKVKQVIERTSSYFDKTPTIRTQLQNSLLRFHFHLNGSSLVINNETPIVTCEEISNGNNRLLNNIYGITSNLQNKKTNHID